MSDQIRITLNTSVMEGLVALGKQMPRVIAAALNDTARGMRTDAVKSVREEFTVKSRSARRGTSLIRASAKRLEAGFVAGGKPLPLVNFSHRPTKSVAEGGRRPKKGITVQAKKAEKGQPLEGSFLARWQKHEKAIYKRKGQKRLPIIQQMGPSLPDMIRDADVADRVLELAQARLQKNVERRTNLAIARATRERSTSRSTALNFKDFG